MYADLEESVGTLDSAKRAYEQMFVLKVITPQLVLSMAAFLEEKGYFEQSFSAYERGVATFGFPWALELWRAYLSKFVGRYGGSKLERTRELYEQSVELWRGYALYELQHGLARHAMRIFERGCAAVAPKERPELFRLHISKAAEAFGVARTRPIYEKAIEALADDAARLLCLEYAQLETKLGEMYDPVSEAKVWSEWNDFEVEHGSEDSFREMLRIKRAVKAQFAAVGAATVRAPATSGGGEVGAAVGAAQDGYIPSDAWRGIQRGSVFKKGHLGLGYYRDELAARWQPLDLAATAAPLEPPLDAPPARRAEREGEEEEEEPAGADADVSVTQRRVPDGVFGSAAGLGKKRSAEEEPIGALERFKRAR
ncbi:hypothetical protein T492DRAFT_890394 [Pavlovales sp. CCMP2436]|nr:hypothetical protein T492DRAFT_890394 [Pavlovales sp. CCMP2436]